MKQSDWAMELEKLLAAALESTGDLAVVGGKSAASALFADYRRRRTDTARDILIEEIRNGGTLPPQVASYDDILGVLFRYERATKEGAARINLRLMAKAIAGKIRADTLVADEFLVYADALASLSRDEIIVIAAIWNFQPAADRLVRPSKSGANPEPWKTVMASLQGKGWSTERAQAAATRALRSGLLVASTPTGWQASGQFQFSASDMLRDLATCIDFEDALRAER